MPTPLSDTTKARIVALRGLNYTHQEIADAVGHHRVTVSRVLGQVREQAAAAEKPVAVFEEYLAALTADRLDADGEGELDYECSACGARYYSEPAAEGCCHRLLGDGGRQTEKYREWGAQSRYGLAKRLAEADPDAVGGDP